MRFQSAMASMARNANHVAQFAARMGWDNAKAEATLSAYSTGRFFPTMDELDAMGAADSLRWAYRSGLVTYWLEKLIASPESAQKLYGLVKKGTVDRWRAGSAIPSGKTRTKIEAAFEIDIEYVPQECRFVYIVVEQNIRFDSRRNRLWLNSFVVSLVEVGENKFVIPLEAMQLGFVEAANSAGLTFVESGDFMRAEPASQVYIYYAKS